jgi:hypothetical protein
MHPPLVDWTAVVACRAGGIASARSVDGTLSGTCRDAGKPKASAISIAELVGPRSFSQPSRKSGTTSAGHGYAALAVVAAIALHGFKTSLGGQPIVVGQGLDD